MPGTVLHGVWASDAHPPTHPKLRGTGCSIGVMYGGILLSPSIFVEARVVMGHYLVCPADTVLECFVPGFRPCSSACLFVHSLRRFTAFFVSGVLSHAPFSFETSPALPSSDMFFFQKACKLRMRRDTEHVKADGLKARTPARLPIPYRARRLKSRGRNQSCFTNRVGLTAPIQGAPSEEMQLSLFSPCLVFCTSSAVWYILVVAE